MHAPFDVDSRPEGPRFERKRDLSPTDSILRTVVAFANGSGGRIAIGVDDDGGIVGVADPIADEERLANQIAHGVTPLVVPDISIIEVDRRAVLLVDVRPSGRRPHHVTSEGPEGTYVRIGASNRCADEPLRAELGRSAVGRSFDEEPAGRIPAEELDVDALAERVPGATEPGRLETLALVTTIDGQRFATNGGVLLASRPPVVVERFPDAVVHAVVFAGDDEALVRRTLGGTIFDMVELATSFVHEHVGDRVSIGRSGTTNASSPRVPRIALRELVVNAFAHADYSLGGGPFRIAVHPDRVEIENPGLLVPGFALDDLGSGVSRVRNRVVARTLREAGYIEQWGSGIARARRELDAAGLLAPVFAELPPARFRVTISTTPATMPQLTGARQELYDALRAAGTGAASTRELVDATGRSERWVRQHAGALVDLGLVAVVGSGPKRRYRVTEQ